MKGHAVAAAAFAAADAAAFAAAASKQMLLLDAASVYLLLLLLCYIDAFAVFGLLDTCACWMLALFSVYPEGFILCLNEFIHLVLATCAFPQRACVRASLDTSANN